MFESSILRILSVLLVMLVVGFVRYGLGIGKLRKSESPDEKAKAKLVLSAKKTAVIAAFFYMVAMVSVVGLFI